MDGYMIPSVIFIVSQVLVAVGGQQSEIDVDICLTQNRIRALRAHIFSPGFPNHVSAPTDCMCKITSSSNMDIGLRYLIGDKVLKVDYIENGESNVWKDMTFVNTSFSNKLGIAIASNVTYAEVVFRTKGDNPSLIQVNVQVNAQVDNTVGELSINCTTLSSDETTTNSNNPEPGGFMATLEEKCSAQLILILGVLCIVFLLIILAVSITLCCLVPKKRQRIREVVRRSRCMINDIRKRKTKTMESCIYDEATFRNSQGLYLEPQGNNTSTLPMNDNRITQHYANTSEW